MRRTRLVAVVGGFALLAVLLIGLWAVAPYHNPQEEEQAAQEVTIRVGSFFFEGPAGRSSSTDAPKVVAKLVNGRKYKLIFENVSSAPHQVVSPLLSAPEEKVFNLRPGEKLEIEVTPEFLTVADGFSLAFDLACHVAHGSGADHYKQGMHALIEVVPTP
jgi:hypothetical protein